MCFLFFHCKRLYYTLFIAKQAAKGFIKLRREARVNSNKSSNSNNSNSNDNINYNDNIANSNREISQISGMIEKLTNNMVKDEDKNNTSIITNEDIKKFWNFAETNKYLLDDEEYEHIEAKMYKKEFKTECTEHYMRLKENKNDDFDIMAALSSICKNL